MTIAAAQQPRWIAYDLDEARPILHATWRNGATPCDQPVGIAAPADRSQFIGKRCPACKRRVYVVAYDLGHWTWTFS